MDASTLIAALALTVSAITALSSAYLVSRQIRVAQKEVNAAAFVELMSDFRNPEFHRNYRYVVDGLQQEYDPDQGVALFDLPEPAFSRTIDVLYFFQNCASFADYGIVSEKIMMTFLHLRFAQVWRAVAPYVEAERRRMGITIAWNLESYAERAEKTSERDVSRVLRRPRRFDPPLSEGAAPARRHPDTARPHGGTADEDLSGSGGPASF